ncbi:MAG: glycyl-radical enzyme activating protein [Clostridia bacterium]|nr:glycyl-radical enzyme activating protein [Clostridia bacterium]
MLGRFFSIEEFSVYDGPGIRTTVFLKGCPLRCSWCHNPEGQSHAIEIARSPNGCLACGTCERFAEKLDGGLHFTKKSIENCPRNLLRLCGEDIEPEALCERLLKNAPILKNGGGITFSGGEPLAQSEFVFECLSLLRGKLHTALQTCGYCDAETFTRALGLCDYVLYDLKIIDDSTHVRYTGVSNQKILQNFRTLAQSGVDFVVRLPLIPTVTDTEDNIRSIAQILNENGVNYIEVLPYNKIAGGKYSMVMREFSPGFDESIASDPRTEIFNGLGITQKIL